MLYMLLFILRYKYLVILMYFSSMLILYKYVFWVHGILYVNVFV